MLLCHLLLYSLKCRLSRNVHSAKLLYSSINYFSFVFVLHIWYDFFGLSSYVKLICLQSECAFIETFKLRLCLRTLYNGQNVRNLADILDKTIYFLMLKPTYFLLLIVQWNSNCKSNMLYKKKAKYSDEHLSS